jgi:hypothetical protein
MSIYLTADLKKDYDVMKQELLSTGVVDAVSKSSSPMTGIYNQWDAFSWEGMDSENHPLFSAIMVDYDYDKTSRIVLREGRFFSEEFATDSSAVVINEAAAELIGFKNPLENTIKFDQEIMKIIGVTENIVMQNPFKPVEPAIMLLRDYYVSQGFIRIRDNVDIKAALAAIQPIVEKHNPAFPFDFKFTDEAFTSKFKNEDQVGKLSGIFAGLSIFISSIAVLAIIFRVGKTHGELMKWSILLSCVIITAAVYTKVCPPDIFKIILQSVSDVFVALINVSHKGTEFLFGSLADPSKSWAYVFAIQVLPNIIFFAALSSILYYLGVLQVVVYVFAYLLNKLKISGADGLSRRRGHW